MGTIETHGAATKYTEGQLGAYRDTIKAVRDKLTGLSFIQALPPAQKTAYLEKAKENPMGALYDAAAWFRTHTEELVRTGVERSQVDAYAKTLNPLMQAIDGGIGLTGDVLKGTFGGGIADWLYDKTVHGVGGLFTHGVSPQDAHKAGVYYASALRVKDEETASKGTSLTDYIGAGSAFISQWVSYLTNKLFGKQVEQPASFAELLRAERYNSDSYHEFAKAALLEAGIKPSQAAFIVAGGIAMKDGEKIRKEAGANAPVLPVVKEETPGVVEHGKDLVVGAGRSLAWLSVPFVGPTALALSATTSQAREGLDALKQGEAKEALGHAVLAGAGAVGTAKAAQVGAFGLRLFGDGASGARTWGVGQIGAWAMGKVVPGFDSAKAMEGMGVLRDAHWIRPTLSNLWGGFTNMFKAPAAQSGSAMTVFGETVEATAKAGGGLSRLTKFAIGVPVVGGVVALWNQGARAQEIIDAHARGEIDDPIRDKLAASVATNILGGLGGAFTAPAIEELNRAGETARGVPEHLRTQTLRTTLFGDGHAHESAASVFERMRGASEARKAAAVQGVTNSTGAGVAPDAKAAQANLPMFASGKLPAVAPVM